MSETFYLSQTSDVVLTENDDVVVATNGELQPDVTIDGTSTGNTLDLSGAGDFDLSAPGTLSDIAIVDGDTAAVNQTITLRPGDNLSLYLGGGDDTVIGADNSDTIYGGTGPGHSEITIGGAGESYIGGDYYATIDIDASFAGQGGATITQAPGGQTNIMNLTGGSGVATTLGSNIEGIQYLNVVNNGVTLDTGAFDSSGAITPTIYLDGTGDAVTLTAVGDSLVDYYGDQQVTMAADDQSLIMPYAGNNGIGTDTLSGFNQSDTIDLLNPNFNTSSNNVIVNYDSAANDLVVTSYDDNTDALVASATIDLTGTYLGSFSIGADPSGDAEVLFSGYSYTAPASPASTQPVFYVGTPDSTDSGLVGSDGTSGGTQLVEPGEDTLQQQGFVGGGNNFDDTVVGGKIYLVQSFGGAPDTAVWVSDGTANGTTPLVDLGALDQTLEPSGPTGSEIGAAGTDAIFLTDQKIGESDNASTGDFNQTFDVTLWSSDGTNAGTSPIDTFTSEDGEAPAIAQYLGSSSSDAYFEVDVGASDIQLWETNGESSGTQEVFDGGGSGISDFVATASGGYFSDNETLYAVDGASASAQLDNAGTVQRVLGAFQSEAVYAASNPSVFGQELVYAGANELGTLSTPGYLLAGDAAVQVGSELVIDDYGTLYGSDGSAGSLDQLSPTGARFVPDGLGNNTLATSGNSVLLDGKLYFALTETGDSNNTYVALYETDGTVAGTNLVTDFQQEVSAISQLTNADGSLYFSASTPGGTFLFRSDGTGSGTYPVGTGTLDVDPAGIVTGVTADNPEPTPQTYDLSSSSPNDFTGTPDNDTFVAGSGALKSGDSISGGGGYDRLVLSGAGTFDLSAPTTLTGISEVDAQPGGVSGSTQTIDLRAGTDMIDRIGSSNSAPYVVVGADNSDTIVGAGGETFSGQPTTQISIGSVNETIEVSNAVLTADTSEAGALVRDPFSLNITGGGTVTLNSGDTFSSTLYNVENGGFSAINLAAAATDLSVAGGSFAVPQYTSVNEAVGGNTIDLGDNGTFDIYGAAGGDTIDMGGALAEYTLIGSAAELENDTVNNFETALPRVDGIDITDFAYANNPTYGYSGTTLTVDDGIGTASVKFDLPGGSSTAFNLIQDGSGTEVVAAICYGAGARILTDRGEVAVEDLRIGDLAVTASGARRPIRWLGHRRTDCRGHAFPDRVLPVRISAHAFGPERPARDLYVSPGHAIAVDVGEEVLIPACELVNGATIQQIEVDEITYWHVELESHDILLAENLAAESYLDMGNRGFFAESAVVDLAAAPDAAPSRRTHADFCRPFHCGDEVVEGVRAQLLERARSLGWTLRRDPLADLHLVVDGFRIDPAATEGCAHFHVPAGAQEVWLASDAARPIDVGRGADRRTLGVCVLKISVDDGFAPAHEISLEDPMFDEGFHPLEGEGEDTWRWMTGRARLQAALSAGHPEGFFLTLALGGDAMASWIAPQREAAASELCPGEIRAGARAPRITAE